MKRLVVWSISIILIIYLGVLGQKGGREEQIIRAKREMKYNICLPRKFELSCLALMVGHETIAWERASSIRSRLFAILFLQNPTEHFSRPMLLC